MYTYLAYLKISWISPRQGYLAISFSYNPLLDISWPHRCLGFHSEDVRYSSSFNLKVFMLTLRDPLILLGIWFHSLINLWLKFFFLILVFVLCFVSLVGSSDCPVFLIYMSQVFLNCLESWRSVCMYVWWSLKLNKMYLLVVQLVVTYQQV